LTTLRRAYHDPLTGLPNRALLLDRVAHALDLHRRDLRALAVLLIDLDNFKAVNDTLGHAAGDELLIRVADRLRGALRPGDTLARLGGDEFAVLLEDGGEPAAVANRVVSCLTEPFRIADTVIRAGASVGVTDLAATTAPVSVDTMLARADLAMYTAKRAGKGRLAVYDPVMTLPEGRTLQLSEPLREALAAGTIRAVFQPICELDTGEVTGYEALARWRHDSVDLPPEVFIPVAARSGLLGELTEYMLDRACEQLARWSDQLGHQRLRVAVNVPPDVLGDRGLPGRIAERLDRYHLGHGQLVLEITEDALMSDPDVARAVAHQLRDIGVRLSLDDFGVGFSSLLHLQRIPLDAVKIDRAFTSDLDSNPRTERFMRALLSLDPPLIVGFDQRVNVVDAL
jgi:diguanylate cyclase (GGDEF)-like protein